MKQNMTKINIPLSSGQTMPNLYHSFQIFKAFPDYFILKRNMSGIIDLFNILTSSFLILYIIQNHSLTKYKVISILESFSIDSMNKKFKWKGKRKREKERK